MVISLAITGYGASPYVQSHFNRIWRDETRLHATPSAVGGVQFYLSPALDEYPLHFIDRHIVVAPVIERRGPRRLMRRHLLRDFPPTAILKVLSNACRPKRMIPHTRLNTRRECPPADHPIDIRLAQGGVVLGVARRYSRQLLTIVKCLR